MDQWAWVLRYQWGSTSQKKYCISNIIYLFFFKIERIFKDNTENKAKNRQVGPFDMLDTR